MTSRHRNAIDFSGSPSRVSITWPLCYRCFQSDKVVEQIVELPVICDAMVLLWRDRIFCRASWRNRLPRFTWDPWLSRTKGYVLYHGIGQAGKTDAYYTRGWLLHKGMIITQGETYLCHLEKYHKMCVCLCVCVCVWRGVGWGVGWGVGGGVGGGGGGGGGVGGGGGLKTATYVCFRYQAWDDITFPFSNCNR